MLITGSRQKPLNVTTFIKKNFHLLTSYGGLVIELIQLPDAIDGLTDDWLRLAIVIFIFKLCVHYL